MTPRETDKSPYDVRDDVPPEWAAVEEQREWTPEEYAWSCAEDMRGWALRAEESARQLREENSALRREVATLKERLALIASVDMTWLKAVERG